MGVALSGWRQAGLNNLFKGQVFALRFDVRYNRVKMVIIEYSLGETHHDPYSFVLVAHLYKISNNSKKEMCRNI